MPVFQCSAILFDLDGVLVDSTRAVTRQYRRWSEENGLDPEKVLRIGHGVRTVEVVRAVAPHLNPETEMRKIEQREAEDRDGVAVMPGAADLIRSLPLDRWCVVTSGTLRLATARLTLANLPIPCVFVTAEDVDKGKPDPAPYLKGAALLGFDRAECLVIEDAPAGIQSAHAGGMKVIAITSTFPADKLQDADVVVQKLSQICVESKNAVGELIITVN
jgi:mannitol-1-/sugar-/sorbitol-6-phosphatase